MSTLSGAYEDAKKMRRHFLVPPDPDVTFSQLSDLVASLQDDYRAVGNAFVHSLRSTVSTVSIPFSLASAGVHQIHFRRIHTAERIRALSMESDSLEAGETLEQARDREAFRIGSQRLREFMESEDGKELIIGDISRFLIASIESDGLELAAKELLQQGVILLWSAFEVLFRDSFEVHLNLNPAKAHILVQNTSTRRRFEVEKVSFEVLANHNFNLSSTLGTLLVRQQDFSDLPLIKCVYPLMFPTAGTLIDRLNDPELWLLFQRRHLLVHRRGIVDQNYRGNTGDSLPLGSTLELTPDDFERYLHVVLEGGLALLHCLRLNVAPSTT